MANLNAPRNLPPDSTPWGRTVDRRLHDLERSMSLMRSEVKNASTGLNALVDRIGGISNASDFAGASTYTLNSSGVPTSNQGDGEIISNNPFEMSVMAPGPIITLPTKTGVVTVTGVMPLLIHATTSIDNEAEVFVGIAIESNESGEFVYFPEHPEGGNNISEVYVKSASRTYSYNHLIPIQFSSGESERMPGGILRIQPIVWTRLWNQTNTSITANFPRIAGTSY